MLAQGVVVIATSQLLPESKEIKHERKGQEVTSSSDSFVVSIGPVQCSPRWMDQFTPPPRWSRRPVLLSFQLESETLVPLFCLSLC